MNATKTWSPVLVQNPKTKHIVTGPRVTTGRESKRIGVEIEWFGADYEDVIRALVRAGIRIRGYVQYDHSVMDQWKIVYDGSVNGQGTNYYIDGEQKGLELVSPPLKSADMEVQLKTVLDTLKACGARVDKSCGIHVHHEIDDLSVDAVKNIYKLYRKHTSTIDALMPTDRRFDAWHDYCSGLNETYMDAIEQATSISEIAEWYDDNQSRRYSVINMLAYLRQGTIEFRHFNGSLEFDEVFNWVMVTQAIVAAGKNRKAIREGKTTCDSFIADCGFSWTEQSAFVLNRRKEIKKSGA